MECSKIKNNILKNCDFPLITGTGNRAFVINKEDIESVIFNVLNKSIVEFIVLKPGAIAYVIEGINNSISPKATLIQNTFTKNYDHLISFIGFDISPETKDNIEKSKEGLFVVITENVFRGEDGSSAFEIYGLSSGLVYTLLEKDPNNADTSGGFAFTLASGKNKENFLPASVFIVSYEATLSFIESLLIPSLGGFSNGFSNGFNV